MEASRKSYEFFTHMDLNGVEIAAYYICAIIKIKLKMKNSWDIEYETIRRNFVDLMKYVN